MNIVLFEKVPADGRMPRKDERALHILKVLRLKVGDSFLLGEVNGYSGRAEVVSIDEQFLSFRWNPENPPQSLNPVSLLVGQVRPICMKRILREAVSLGVSEILIVGTDTGEKSYRDAKLWSTGEYKKYLLDGAQQSGETGVGDVSLYPSLESCLEALSNRSEELFRIVLDNGAASVPLSVLPIPKAGWYILAVGSERGWSNREREKFAEHSFACAGLGARILRTETACGIGMGLLLSRLSLI